MPEPETKPQITCMFPRRIPSDIVARLPMGAYRGEIVLVETDEDADAAVDEISKETLLGFDTESKPSFKKGHSYPVSILQIGGENKVWIFRLGRLDWSMPRVYSILENPSIKKVGVAVNGDISALKGLREFEPAGFEDISDKTRKIGIVNTGLRNLLSLFTGFRISKSAQMSNWAADELSKKQILYAATDAWASRLLYLEVEKLFARGGYVLEPAEDETAKKRGIVKRFFAMLRSKFFA
ncbi:MAG: 3'-5' exonuclease domain-containing protein 2 [Opitutales bacterium]|nr:3'-5' exonuclease domain-containing protein 2 [Opitutales bacterium]